MRKFIKKIYSYEFIRYSIGGGVAALLDLFILWLCTDIFGIYYLFSVVIAFVISVSFAFFFQKYITFKDKSKKYLREGSLFVLFQIVGQGIYMLVLRLGVDMLGLYYLLVAVCGKFIAFVRNYLSNRLFNFKN